MNSKKAFLLLNGAKPTVLPDLTSYKLVCAVDGAYNFLKSKNIIPDLVTGDFDSINKIPTNTEVIETEDQNFTDFEKTLLILKEKGFNAIDVYGGSGLEHDHFLGNISTALKLKNELTITFFDDFGRYFFIEKSITLTNVKNKTISLIPFPEAQNITTKGLKYPLKNEILTFGTRIGTRNKASENEVIISYKSGELLIFVGNK
ncbi:thiamine diphosphokinase [Lutibacter sp. B1]|uniref:thiamine diphosphokinase n=1 Tax=Lutibacter sp. B1 TaxID=2725996 RepID=UPI001456B7F1|nr:thiamine diphosphokinase [Lutibacter sp. B1]NLP58909.1 thiamine diphosphokinase [Lutibacter sp. B1]